MKESIKKFRSSPALISTIYSLLSSSALSCILLGLYFGRIEDTSWTDWLPDVVPVVTIFLAAIAQLASVGSKIVVEKDWIVVISM